MIRELKFRRAKQTNCRAELKSKAGYTGAQMEGHVTHRLQFIGQEKKGLQDGKRQIQQLVLSDYSNRVHVH